MLLCTWKHKETVSNGMLEQSAKYNIKIEYQNKSYPKMQIEQ